MAKLNVNLSSDPTLEAMDQQILKKKEAEKQRNYLGASQIGNSCYRKLFYSFRGAEKILFNETCDETELDMEINRVKAAEDGHYQELAIIKNLRTIPGIEIFNDDGTVDENGNPNQIGFQMLLGHFRGHVDGVITGILQSPGTPHVLEIKCRLEKFINKLEKLIAEHGEKNALREWEEEYYAQAQIYMHEMKLTRHYLVASTPGGRRQISVRTEYNRKEAEAIIEKAKSIIFDNWILPERISDKREFYKCKWCEYQEICHDGAFPLVNCKTCRYSEPVQGGQRECGFNKEIIPEETLHVGCKYHVYNPALIQAKLIEHLEEGCLYRIESKNINFANVFLTGIPPLDKKIDAMYTSIELREKIKTVDNINPQISDNVKAAFAGTECEDTKAEKKMWTDGMSKKIDPRLKGI
jgi:CRISPR/Cas system-associated exonuclease Cas4 (RecB family)